jgi:hypothetical protein
MKYLDQNGNLTDDYYGYVYLTLDQKHNLLYVGQKSGLVEKSKNYFGSGNIIVSKKKSKGVYFLKKIILGVCYTIEELNECETECIYFFRSFGSDGENHDRVYGYNLTKTGRGFSGRKGKLSPSYGTSFFKRWVKKYGIEIAKEKLEERNKKMYNSRDKWTVQQKEDLSNIMSEKFSGEGNPMYGTGGFYDKWLQCYGKEIADEKKKETNKKHSETVKNKSGEEKNEFSEKCSIRCSGEGNPMYGTKGFYGKWVEAFGEDTAIEMRRELYKKRSEKVGNKSLEEKEVISKKISKKVSESRNNSSDEDNKNRIKKFQETMKNKSEKERLKIIENREITKKKNGVYKKYLLITPEEEEIIIQGGFTKYCKENNLNMYYLRKVLKGELDNWNNWKCKIIEN